MILSAVRIQNYKSVEDSNRFSIADMTCLVGKNESGKTALVSCLRSSHGEASDVGEDLVRGLHPHEWFGIRIVGGQEQANRVLQRTRAAVAAAPNLLLGQFGEPAFHLVYPRRVGRREVEVETWMAN
jgi:predicted ATP-dependent endonuclease of OLD family